MQTTPGWVTRGVISFDWSSAQILVVRDAIGSAVTSTLLSRSPSTAASHDDCAMGPRGTTTAASHDRRVIRDSPGRQSTPCTRSRPGGGRCRSRAGSCAAQAQTPGPAPRRRRRCRARGTARPDVDREARSARLSTTVQSILSASSSNLLMRLLCHGDRRPQGKRVVVRGRGGRRTGNVDQGRALCTGAHGRAPRGPNISRSPSGVQWSGPASRYAQWRPLSSAPHA